MSKTGSILLVALLALFVASLLSPLISPLDPYGIDLDALRLPPSPEHPFGTDSKGRDILSRIVHGARISIGIALLSALVSASVGFAVGLTSGYFGGRFDTVMMAVVDFVLSFPSLLLAVAISIVLPPGPATAVVAIAAVGWTSFARLIRGYVMTVRTMPFIEAARAMGCSHARVLLAHIAPLCIPLSLVLMGIKIGGFILTEATLSFLGLGVQPPTPTWGSMISAHRGYLLSAPWMVLFPGLAISLTAFCFNVIGESLRKRFDFKDPGV